MKFNTRNLVTAAVIASIYSVLTIAIAPMSYGMFQLRISEALTVLPIFTPAAIPGLFIGCLIANLLSPVGVADVIIGSLASLVAAILTYRLRHNKMLAMLPPVIVNGVVIGMLLYYYYGVPASLIMCMVWVMLGQAVACYGIGFPLIKILEGRKSLFDDKE